MLTQGQHLIPPHSFERNYDPIPPISVEGEGVLKLIEEFCVSGDGGISAKFLKNIKIAVSVFLSDLVHQSLDSGSFCIIGEPHRWSRFSKVATSLCHQIAAEYIWRACRVS